MLTSNVISQSQLALQPGTVDQGHSQGAVTVHVNPLHAGMGCSGTGDLHKLILSGKLPIYQVAVDTVTTPQVPSWYLGDNTQILIL